MIKIIVSLFILSVFSSCKNYIVDQYNKDLRKLGYVDLKNNSFKRLKNCEILSVEKGYVNNVDSLNFTFEDIDSSNSYLNKVEFRAGNNNKLYEIEFYCASSDTAKKIEVYPNSICDSIEFNDLRFLTAKYVYKKNTFLYSNSSNANTVYFHFDSISSQSNHGRLSKYDISLIKEEKPYYIVIDSVKFVPSGKKCKIGDTLYVKYNNVNLLNVIDEHPSSIHFNSLQSILGYVKAKWNRDYSFKTIRHDNYPFINLGGISGINKITVYGDGKLIFDEIIDGNNQLGKYFLSNHYQRMNFFVVNSKQEEIQLEVLYVR